MVREIMDNVTSIASTRPEKLRALVALSAYLNGAGLSLLIFVALLSATLAYRQPLMTWLLYQPRSLMLGPTLILEDVSRERPRLRSRADTAPVRVGRARV